MGYIIKRLKGAWKYNTAMQYPQQGYSHILHPQRWMSFFIYFCHSMRWCRTMTWVVYRRFGKITIGFTGYYFTWGSTGKYSYGREWRFLWFYLVKNK